MRLDTVRKLFWGILAGMAALLAVVALGGDAEALDALRGILLVALSVGVIGLLVWWFRDRPQQDAVAATARRLGLRFSARDPFDLLGSGFALLGRAAHSRHVLNVMWGRWRELEVRAFVFREQRTDDEVLTYACAMTPAPTWWPPLVVRGETPIRLAADAVGLRDLQLESEDFNRTFEVRAADAAFATAFLEQRMMARLLELGGAFAFEVRDGALLVAVQTPRPWEVELALVLLADLRGSVPSVLESLYPPAVPLRPDRPPPGAGSGP